MENENISIEIDGEEVDDNFYQDLISAEVELDDELAGFFRIQMAIRQQSDGVWTYVDDERLSVWKQVTITAGLESDMEELMSGYITHINLEFDPDPSQCILEISGMDGSILMDREEKLKDWPNKKDSDIASEIFGLYGFSPEVEDTEVIHDEAVSTIIQRETDMQFLMRLALRNGFDCYVQGTDGYFGSPQLDESPQPLLAIHFGEESNLNSFSIEVNSITPVNVSMSQIDRMNKELLDVSVESAQQTSLGDTGPADILASGMEPGKVYMGMNTATGIPEMEALAQGIYHKAEWFVTGTGEISGNVYGHVLKPRKTVTIKGINEIHSGVYYVSRVTHFFSSNGYIQTFSVKRNAIMVVGDEDFASSGGGLF